MALPTCSGAHLRAHGVNGHVGICDSHLILCCTNQASCRSLYGAPPQCRAECCHFGPSPKGWYWAWASSDGRMVIWGINGVSIHGSMAHNDIVPFRSAWRLHPPEIGTPPGCEMRCESDLGFSVLAASAQVVNNGTRQCRWLDDVRHRINHSKWDYLLLYEWSRLLSYIPRIAKPASPWRCHGEHSCRDSAPSATDVALTICGRALPPSHSPRQDRGSPM